LVDALVFSKDRACQLDLLLRSIAEHAAGLYSSLTVLYTGSDADHLRGYSLCFSEHAPAKFVIEHGFEAQTRRWLSLAGPIVSFLVDDDVFYRDAPDLSAPAGFVFDGAVSLRGGDYDYPFSVDGNIYRRRDVENLLEGLRFRDPTELEAHGHNARARLPFTAVTPARPACLVGVPLNRVSSRSRMPHMGVPPAVLNERYLAGRRLRYDLDDDIDLPAHAELPARWTDPSTIGGKR
jgi:hypothetical protein